MKRSRTSDRLRLEQVRAEGLHRHPSKTGDRGHMTSRNNRPLVGCEAAQVERATQSGSTASLFDGGSASISRSGFRVRHTLCVENSSTPRNQQSSKSSLHHEVEKICTIRPMAEDQNKLDVGARLRQAREALGYGLREFARLRDVDPTKLSNWERGKNYPDPEFIKELWRHHRISADWIYLGEIAGLPHGLVVSLQGASQASPVARTEERPRAPKKSGEIV